MAWYHALVGQPRSRVRMLVSAAEYVAGKSYEMPVGLADRFIARGYAEGNLSRAYSPDELNALRGNDSQVVGL